MELPKQLPESPGPWGALYHWLNALRDFVQAAAPAGSSTVQQARTSKGTMHQVTRGDAAEAPGGAEPGVPRWG